MRTLALVLGLGALSTLGAQGEAQKQQQSVKPAIQPQPFSWTQVGTWRKLSFLKWLETIPGLPPYVELRLREQNGFTVLTIGPAAPPSATKLNCKPNEKPVQVFCSSPDVPPQPIGECCMDQNGRGCEELLRKCIIEMGGCANLCPLRLVLPVGSSALSQLEASYYPRRLLAAIQTLPLQPLEDIHITFHLTPSGYVQTDSVALWLLPQTEQKPRPASWRVHVGYYFPRPPRNQREFFELRKKGPQTCNTWSECENWTPIPGYTFSLIAFYWPEEAAPSGARPHPCGPQPEKEPHIAVSPAGQLSLDLPE